MNGKNAQRGAKRLEWQAKNALIGTIINTREKVQTTKQARRASTQARQKHQKKKKCNRQCRRRIKLIMVSQCRRRRNGEKTSENKNNHSHAQTKPNLHLLRLVGDRAPQTQQPALQIEKRGFGVDLRQKGGGTELGRSVRQLFLRAQK